MFHMAEKANIARTVSGGSFFQDLSPVIGPASDDEHSIGNSPRELQDPINATVGIKAPSIYDDSTIAV